MKKVHKKKVVQKIDIEKVKALKSSQAALNYARDVIKGRWEEGEDVIALSAGCSYTYAVNVLYGRFEKGEPEIAKVDDWLKCYEKYVLGGRKLVDVRKEKYSVWRCKYLGVCAKGVELHVCNKACETMEDKVRKQNEKVLPKYSGWQCKFKDLCKKPFLKCFPECEVMEENIREEKEKEEGMAKGNKVDKIVGQVIRGDLQKAKTKINKLSVALQELELSYKKDRSELIARLEVAEYEARTLEKAAGLYPVEE